MSICETTVMQSYVTNWKNEASSSPHLVVPPSSSSPSKTTKQHQQHQLPFISPSASSSSSPTDASNSIGSYLVLIGWKTVCYAGVAIKMVIMVVLVSILWVILFIPQIEHYLRLAFAYLFPKKKDEEEEEHRFPRNIRNASKLCEIITDKQYDDGDVVMLDLQQPTIPKEKTESPAVLIENPSTSTSSSSSLVRTATASAERTTTTQTTMRDDSGEVVQPAVDSGIKFTMKRRTKPAMRSSSPCVRFSEAVEVATGPKSKSTSAMQTTSPSASLIAAAMSTSSDASSTVTSTSMGMKRAKPALKRSVKWADE